jgi:hypothetical protein
VLWVLASVLLIAIRLILILSYTFGVVSRNTEVVLSNVDWLQDSTATFPYLRKGLQDLLQVTYSIFKKRDNV